MLVRNSYARGWVPDADSVNGPVDGLLRADNLTLDELGAVSLRLGSAKINGVAFADTDVHSLFTASLSGTRYRMAGATNAVYANGSSIASGVAGSGDIAFGSHQGQILFARSTTKKKYDGSTVRNWGITQTGGTPTVAGLAADSKVFATCNSADAEFTWNEDDGTGAGYAAGYDGTANGAIVLRPSTTTGRGTVTKTFGSDQDFTAYSGGQVGSDNDIIEFYVYTNEPVSLLQLRLMIDVNSSSSERFENDYYFFDFDPEKPQAVANDDGLSRNYSAQGYQRRRVRQTILQERNDPGGDEVAGVDEIVTVPKLMRQGWTRFSVRRSQMQRVGNTTGKDWSSVRAVAFTVRVSGGGTASLLRFDNVRIIGGAQRPLLGAYKWAYVLVRNSGTYNAISAVSAYSAETIFEAGGATITVPADGSRDSQVNEIWLYRFGGVMDGFYRVTVKTGVSGTGAVTIDDTTSDADAMVTNVKLQTDNTTPPDNIIDIEGPYFDRTFALTSTDLYPSRRLNPDSFATGQVVHIAGADEVGYWVKKALGGIYIGTSKDIYRLDGTGAELPDDTIDFTLTPLNIDHPPVNDAIAQDGNLLVYFADDGWRAMAGSGSKSLTGYTSLLYRGLTRHGVSPVNLSTGRFRAAIAKGRLVAMTPEGASTTSTGILYRYVADADVWYRHSYTPTFRCVYREPDGTLIASDTSGFVWTLDSGTQDAGSDIAIVMWTKVDDAGMPYQRKDPNDLRVRIDTGGNAATLAIHLDGSGSVATNGTKTLAQNGEAVELEDLTTNALPVFTQAQYRVTGSFSTFKWYDSTLNFRERNMSLVGKVEKTNVGYAGEKVIAGLILKLCTLGAARTITPYLDGVATSQTFSVTTGASDPETTLLQFTAAQTATDIAWSASDAVEVVDWAPIVLYQLPVRIKVWENKPLVPSAVRRRFGGLTVQCNTHGASATLTPVVDGTDQSAITFSSSDLIGKTLTFQDVVGRDLWCRITSSTAFNVHGVEPIVLETLPQQFQGLTPRSTFGYPGVKTVSGIQLRICTLGSALSVTPYIDGDAQDAESITSTTDNPIDTTIAFTESQEGVEFSLLLSANAELYSWSPIVTAQRPLGVKSWDSGPLDLGTRELVWLREMFLKVRAGDDLTITPWFDGHAYPSVTATVTAGVDTIVPIYVGRNYVGRQPRLVVTSASSFYPYWIKVLPRLTGQGGQKPAITIPVTLMQSSR